MSTGLTTALQNETDKLLGCIHCGLCLPACPTYQQLGNENDSPRGRIYLMRAVAEGRLEASSPAYQKHIDLCLGCRACETACPAGVNYGFLLEAAREDLLKQKTANPTKRGGLFQKSMLKLALRHMFPYPWRLRLNFLLLRLVRSFPLTKWALRSGFLKRQSAQMDFAFSLLDTTRPTGKATRRDAAQCQTTKPRAVSVFTGCVMEGLFKHVNDATTRVLAVNGARNQHVGAQACCGALHAHSGELDTARQLARRNIEAFEHEAANATIIINAAGCGALLKEYGELLKHDEAYAERAKAFAARVKDVTEFLADGEIKAGAELNQTVTYDAPCHLYHAQRVQTAPQKVLQTIPGLEYKQLAGFQDCCGGAGIYNLSEPEMSEALLSDKIHKVKATGADTLVTANPGCHMQLGAGVRMFDASCEVKHVVEMLDESYRRAGFYDGDGRST